MLRFYKGKNGDTLFSLSFLSHSFFSGFRVQVTGGFLIFLEQYGRNY